VLHLRVFSLLHYFTLQVTMVDDCTANRGDGSGTHRLVKEYNLLKPGATPLGTYPDDALANMYEHPQIVRQCGWWGGKAGSDPRGDAAGVVDGEETEEVDEVEEDIVEVEE
jgi:hypothetical protein